ETQGVLYRGLRAMSRGKESKEDSGLSTLRLVDILVSEANRESLRYLKIALPRQPVRMSSAARAISRAWTMLSSIEKFSTDVLLGLDGKPQRPQGVQKGLTIAEPDGFLEEDGHGPYAREPAP